MAKRRIDAVVIGGGHNGLVAAAYLQKAGRKVRLLEREEQVGGILRPTSPAPGFTAPGLVHTVGRLRSSVIKDLKLERHGYRTVSPDVRLHAPMPDGSAVTFWADASKTAEGIAERNAADADAYVTFDRKVRAIASFLARSLPRSRTRSWA
jgi:phytoene dehydrogenase-like protein